MKKNLFVILGLAAALGMGMVACGEEESGGSCTGNEMKCENGSAYSYINGKWEPQETLIPCDEEQSISQTENDPCTSEEAESCSSDYKTAFYCSGGKVAKLNCADRGADYQCNVFDNKADCYLPCKESEKDTTGMVCVKNYDTEATMPVRCAADAFNRYAWAKDPYPTKQGENCEGSCVDGACVSSGATVDCSQADPETSSCDGNTLVRNYSGANASCNDWENAKVDCSEHGGCQEDGNGYANCKDWY